MNGPDDTGLNCPVPSSGSDRVLIAHGGGGRLMHRLIEDYFLAELANPWLLERHDGALLEVGTVRLAFTTDAYVVRPLFFPGGDIGRLAVFGTVNDLAVCGARPLYLSASFILEEGFPISTLHQIVRSVRDAACRANVAIVTGDTKVVEKGKGHDLFITTAGVGIVEGSYCIGPRFVEPGDMILLSGDVGRHGIAIMAARESLAFQTTLESDCAPLADLVGSVLKAGVNIHCMRDLTRGGLASALVEIAHTSGRSLEFAEDAVPVAEEVRGACELLGLDPLYVACEGRCVLFCPAHQAEQALERLRADPLGQNAAIIGKVLDVPPPPRVTRISRLGTRRLVDLPAGEQLPRIC